MLIAALVAPKYTIEGQRIGRSILDYMDKKKDYSDVLTPEQLARLSKKLPLL